MLETKAVSLTLATTSAIAYLACALSFYLIPSWTIWLFNTWLHGVDINIIASSRSLGAVDFLAGLISISVLSYIAGAVFTAIYNRLSANCGARQ